jgi:hypothetical protein
LWDLDICRLVSMVISQRSEEFPVITFAKQLDCSRNIAKKVNKTTWQVSMTESFLNVPYKNNFSTLEILSKFALISCFFRKNFVKVLIPFTGVRLFLIIVCWLLIAAPADNAIAETTSGPPVMDITFKDNLISAELVDIPLIDVLQRIKQKFGFKMHLHSDLNEMITLSFTDMPLDKCLRLLTAKHSLSVAFMPTTKSSEPNNAKQIAEIWILSHSKTPQTMNTAFVPPVTPSPDSSANGGEINEDSPGLSAIEQPETVPVDQLPNNPDIEERSN